MTKGFGLDVVLDALGSGLVDLGENYAQDLHAKADALDVRNGRPCDGTSSAGCRRTRCG